MNHYSHYISDPQVMAIARIVSLLRKSSILHKSYVKLRAHMSGLIDLMPNIDTVSLPIKAINRNTQFNDGVAYEGTLYLELWKNINS